MPGQLASSNTISGASREPLSQLRIWARRLPLGTLQQAATANGTYTSLPAATSPYTNAPAAAAAFYRVKVQ